MRFYQGHAIQLPCISQPFPSERSPVNGFAPIRHGHSHLGQRAGQDREPGPARDGCDIGTYLPLSTGSHDAVSRFRFADCCGKLGGMRVYGTERAHEGGTAPLRVAGGERAGAP